MKFIRNTNDRMKVQRDQIESQRDQIQVQHDTVYSQKKMMTDSISYAERIQSAILPSDSRLNELLDEHFVFFKPKDIVSGDFYWIKEVQDHLVIVGADCTGHGVPGAFMSMLGITMLNDLIGDKCFDAPGAVLEQLRIKIKDMLDQEGNVKDQKDGMDMAIAILDKKTRMLHFAGANNPLYVIRNKALLNGNHLDPYFSTEDDNYQLFELKGDKQPIGVHWEETKFTNHTISLQEEDTIYIFSDGFVDQFGGDNRKKFKSVNFKKLLLSIQKESMEKQGEVLRQTYDTWRGANEQIDDVSVFGIRV
jgi:serine phosphatase RsbU (regulator of sigma subunit)